MKRNDRREELAVLANRLGPIAARDVQLGPMTTYRVGGAAALLVRAASVADLRRVTAALDGLSVPVVVLGKGSNLLVADAGFNGLVIVLGGSSDDLDIPSPPNEPGGIALATAGASVALPVVARRTVAAGWSGFEWAVGVPGSIGGAVRMNAGGHGSDMAASLEWVHLYHLRRGIDRPVTAESLGLRFRGSALGDDHVVLSATLRLTWTGNSAAGNGAIDKIVRWRRDHQPGGQNAGSVFVNPQPHGDSAGKLIDDLGLRGFRIGTAEVSMKHANFIQSDDGGRSADVVAVMSEVRRRVEDEYGLRLRSEIRLLGFDEVADDDLEGLLPDSTEQRIATVRLEHVFEAAGADRAFADPSLPFVAPAMARADTHVEATGLGVEGRADLHAAFTDEANGVDVGGSATAILPSDVGADDDELDEVTPPVVAVAHPARPAVVIVDREVGTLDLDAGSRAESPAGTAHGARSPQPPIVITDQSVADIAFDGSDDASWSDATRQRFGDRLGSMFRRERVLLTPRERLMRRRRRIFYGALSTVTLVAAALIVLSSPLMGVRVVDVEGQRYADPDRIARVVDSLLGISVLTADTAEARRRLEDDPWVERARVSTYFPDRVVIELDERVPVAWFAGVDGSARVIDVTGHVVAVVEGVPTTYARIDGVGPNLAPGAVADLPFRAAAQLSQSLPDELAPLAVTYGVTETGLVTMTLATGTIVTFGEPVDMRSKLVSLVVLLRRQNPNELSSVDVSSGDPVVQSR